MTILVPDAKPVTACDSFERLQLAKKYLEKGSMNNIDANTAKEVIRNNWEPVEIHRIYAKRFLDKFITIESKPQNQIQKLPLTARMERLGNRYESKLHDSSLKSWSSIKPDPVEESSSMSEMASNWRYQEPSKFLEFSMIKERKTRAQLLSEISYESECHNIYAPEFSETSLNSSSESSISSIKQSKTRIFTENPIIVPKNAISPPWKIPFLKKIQSYIQEPNTHRTNFKWLSKKGPVVVHHRSLAMNGEGKNLDK